MSGDVGHDPSFHALLGPLLPSIALIRCFKRGTTPLDHLPAAAQNLGTLVGQQKFTDSITGFDSDFEDWRKVKFGGIAHLDAEVKKNFPTSANVQISLVQVDSQGRQFVLEKAVAGDHDSSA